MPVSAGYLCLPTLITRRLPVDQARLFPRNQRLELHARMDLDSCTATVTLPGEGGQIQLTGTDILTRGIPAGTPQLARVELAR